jgi:putative inorganic carbon (HCO3(-)) transporter
MNKLNLKEKIVLGVLVLLAIIATGFIVAKYGTLAFGLIAVLFVTILAIFKIFKDPFWGFSAIVFFLPFERFPTYPIGGTDIKINTVLGFIVLLAWIFALMFNGKKWKVQPNALAVPLALFVMAVLLSLTQAVNLDRAYMVTAFVLFTISLGVLAINMISSKEDLQKIIKVLFYSSLVAGGFGLFQFAGDVVGLPSSITLLKQDYDSRVFGFPRIQAFSMEPLYFANYLFLPICLGLAYFFGQVKNFVNRWWMVALTIILLLNLVLTVSRGAYIGFVGAFLVLSVLMFKKIFTWKNVVVMFVSVAVVGYAVAFALSNGDTRATNEFVKHVLVKDFSSGESVQGRLTASSRAYSIYQENPVLGIGLGNYGPYVKSYPANTPKNGWDIVNNEYLEVMAETGTVGIISFGLILLILIIRSIQAVRQAKDEFLRLTMIGMLAAMVGVLVQYVSLSTLYIIHIWVLIGLMVATQNLIFKNTRMNNESIK